MGPASLQGPNIPAPMRSLLGGFTLVLKKLARFNHNFTSVGVVSVCFLVAVVSTDFFFVANLCMKILAEVYLVTTLLSAQQEVCYVPCTLLACTHFYSSPVGLLGQQ